MATAGIQTKQRSAHTGDYRSYHFQLLDHVLLTAVVDHEGRIVESCVSLGGAIDPGTVKGILCQVIKRGELEPSGQIEIHGADVRESFCAAVEEADARLLALEERLTAGEFDDGDPDRFARELQKVMADGGVAEGSLQ